MHEGMERGFFLADGARFPERALADGAGLLAMEHKEQPC